MKSDSTPVQICPVVLAGGTGTRLWPLSREGYPKQLLPLRGDHSLIQETVLRLDGLAPSPAEWEGPTELEVNAPIVVCHESHRFFVAEQMEGIGREPACILLEQAGRNTAPALTVAALRATRNGSDPVLLAMPADHAMDAPERFHQAVRTGIDLARAGSIVTFGIPPTAPETGYGYVRKGERLSNPSGAECFALAGFAEKPDRTTAEAYLTSGEYYWNGGLFIMLASVWLDAIGRHRPDIAESCEQAVAGGSADGVFYRVDGAAFSNCPADSIDYAVMEHLSGVPTGSVGAAEQVIPAAVVPLDAGWSDVGSWPAFMSLNGPDDTGNVVSGDVYQAKTRNSLLISNNRLVAAVGLTDTIVVETADAVLVTDKDHGQEVRQVVDWLKANGRDEGRQHRRVHRPWGSYEQVDAGDRFQVKRLVVKPGAALSLQMHHHRAEHWVVVRGTARVTRGDEQFLLSENESTHIPLGVKHRLENPGHVPLEVIEVQSGCYLGEDDIVRFEDRYNRTTSG